MLTALVKSFSVSNNLSSLVVVLVLSLTTLSNLGRLNSALSFSCFCCSDSIATSNDFFSFCNSRN